MFQKSEITKFQGLNSTVAPELFGEEQGVARDIMNFRMEKVGKLVSRNGYIHALFTGECAVDVAVTSPPFPCDNDPLSGGYAAEYYAELESRIASYVNSRGIVGLGEMIFDEKWNKIDTDRVAIYFVRTEPTVTAGYITGYSGAYLFSPMSGKYKDMILYGATSDWMEHAGTNYADTMPTVEVHKYRAFSPQANDLMTVPLQASVREMPFDDVGVIGLTNLTSWIDDYISLSQYRHQVLIADRINGDMILEDHKKRNPGAGSYHDLMLRPNALETFDIDIVHIDHRFLTAQENDATPSSLGVETGMALYKFIAPTEFQLTTVDHFEDKLGNVENYEMNTQDKVAIEGNLAAAGRFFDASDTCMKFYGTQGIDDNDPSDFYFKHGKRDYIFTNSDGPDIYHNILAPLELQKDTYTDGETGEVIEEYATDVFKWDEYPMTYYPSSGIEITSGDIKYLLRDIDKFFSKKFPGAKIIPLEIPERQGGRVPLGGWSYRFVWDFGEGIYSAPSAEVLVPDIMWSATRDAELSTYMRPTDFGENNQKIRSIIADILFVDEVIFGSTVISPALFDGSWDLTSFGEKIFGLKKEIYGEQNHKYGVKDWVDITDVNNLPTDAEGRKERSDLGVMITAFYSSGDLELKGFIYEGMYSTRRNMNSILGISNKLGTVAGFGKLVVPIFKDLDRIYTFNSLFTDEGDLRLLWLADTGNIFYEDRGGDAGFAVWNNNPPKSKFLMFPTFVSNISPVTDGFPTYGMIGSEVDASILFPGMSALPDQLSGWHLTDPDEVSAIGYSNTYAIKESGVFLNFICADGISKNDYYQYLYNFSSGDGFVPWGDELRPSSIFKGVQRESDKLTYFTSEIPNEIIDRLFVQGIAPLRLLENGEQIGVGRTVDWLSGVPRDRGIISFPPTIYPGGTYDRTPWALFTGGVTHPFCRKVQQTASVTEGTEIHNDYPDNITVEIYGEAQRFTGIEQLTAYFPSSLLFNSPRIGLKISNADIPKRAKELLIFRTKSILDNSWQPKDYGLVESVSLDRNNDGDVITQGYIDDSGAEVDYAGFYYFDETKDSYLDFGDTPTEYDGSTYALKSRFVKTLNERAYFANYTETYQPLAPRGHVDGSNIGYVIFPPEGNQTGLTGTYEYSFVFEDELKIKSPIKRLTLTLSNQIVAFYYLPYGYDNTIKELKIYRDSLFLASLEDNVAGIFVDDGSIAGTAINWEDNPQWSVGDNNYLPDVQHYESGVKFSEPFRPDWIKIENFAEYSSGDGDQITGVESQYGNLVVFKENSMHRVAVQSQFPPISRTDEISPEIGCVAPNTLININNDLYFLSWSGFMKYDNNQFQAIDGLFAEELRILLATYKDYIRDASAGYNAHYKEIYLNIPKLPSEKFRQYPEIDYTSREIYDIEGDHGNTNLYDHKYEVFGHIFVINLEKQYITKFAYPAGLLGEDKNNETAGLYGVRRLRDVRQLLRKYYSDSLGNLRSADIMPIEYGWTEEVDTSKYYYSGVFYETPYLRNFFNAFVAGNNNPLYDDKDELLDAYADETSDWYTDQPFPPIMYAPIHSVFKSQFFTGNDESMMKRLRSTDANIFSHGYISMRSVVLSTGMDNPLFSDDRITNLTQGTGYDALFVATGLYDPSITTGPHHLWGAGWEGTGTSQNELTLINTSYVENEDEEMFGRLVMDDKVGKPVRASIELESEYRTQINSIGFWWRPIYQYLQ